MEGGASLLHISSPRIPASIPARLFLSRARSSFRCAAGRPGEPGCSRKSVLAESYRPFPFWRVSFLNMHISHHKSQSIAKVLSSCEPQEVDIEDKQISTNKFIIDCGEDQQCVVGGIVALGKFDALHVGHRELAIQASKVGSPFLLSFVGIAEVLGWESRPPIVAKCDRKRVLSSWAPYCGNIVPLEYHIDFSSVRHLSPRQFVERLSKELRVGGVVAGENYRFGYKAAGDAKDLAKLSLEHGLSAFIVRPVMDTNRLGSQNGASSRQVSSTRVREALAACDMSYVAKLLGRKHRLVLMPASEEYLFEENTITAPKSCILNQPPGDGEFVGCTLLFGDAVAGFCRVVIDSKSIRIELEHGKCAADLVADRQRIDIEFS